jgi:hypothetical protein
MIFLKSTQIQGPGWEVQKSIPGQHWYILMEQEKRIQYGSCPSQCFVIFINLMEARKNVFQHMMFLCDVIASRLCNLSRFFLH